MTRPVRVALLGSDAHPAAWLEAGRAAGLELTPYQALTVSVREAAAEAWRRAVAESEGLVFTSLNGVAASARLREPEPRPWAAVGPATAAAAQAAGYGPPALVAGPPHDGAALAEALAPTPARRWAWPCGNLADGAWAAGLAVAAVPVYDTRPAMPPEAERRFRAALAAGGVDWIVLLSPSGVASLAALGLEGALAGVRIAVIGKRTAAALEAKLGRRPDALPERNAKEALLAAIARRA